MLRPFVSCCVDCAFAGTDINSVDVSSDQSLLVAVRSQLIRTDHYRQHFHRLRNSLSELRTNSDVIVQTTQGDTFNLVRMFAFPAAAPRQPSKVFAAHGSHVTAVSNHEHVALIYIARSSVVPRTVLVVMTFLDRAFLHATPCTQVRFSAKDNFVISVGGYDCAVCVWRVVK